MEIDENFDGYKSWVEGSRQTVIGEPSDTKEDVIRFMHAHIEHFGLQGQFTFDSSRIVQNGNEFIVRIHKFGGNPRVNRLRFGMGLQPELDAASKK